MNHTRIKKQKGFTLIELLVVISIIGLLSTIILGSIASARTKAYEARAKTELGQIRIVLEQYYDEYGGYPYPGNDAFYCLGGECVFAGTSGSVLNSLSINLQPEPLFIASVAVPNFTGRMITVGDVTFSGYSYIPCESPSTVGGRDVCPGNSTETDVSIIAPVGDVVKSVSASNGFQLTDYSYSGDGSDSGSDSGSDGGYTDSDGDSIYDSSDNCPYVYNSDQADSNGYDDYNGDGDACESISSDSGSDGGYMDTDGDGTYDTSDNCPYVYNSDQADYNGYEDYSGDGDACEPVSS